MEYTLVLLRHGQSLWNLENVFTGWTDVALSERGVEEAKESGRLMGESGLSFDVVHTSLQRRAINTAVLALDEMDLGWVPVEKHWRLNERHYGALQGLNKKQTTEEHGPEQVQVWRRSYDTPPPALERTDPRHPLNDARYAWMPSELAPATECLADVVDRVLVAAHGNSLRALVKHLDVVSDEEITSLNIPTGIPLVYRLDDDLRPIESNYLGDPEAAKAAAEAVAKQAGTQ